MKTKNIALRSGHELLPLGAKIEYHHRAATARHQRAWQPHNQYQEEIPRGWKLKEGIYKDENIPACLSEGTDLESWYGPEFITIRWSTKAMGTGIFAEPSEERADRFYKLKDAFHNWPQACNANHYGAPAYNKTVFVWPADGSGVVIGIIRKGIGTSQSSYYYGGNGYFEPDYDPGGLMTDLYVDLYVVKERYEGTEFILCPLWGVKEIDS